MLTILVHHADRKTTFSKPEDLYVGEYWVKQGDKGEAVVHVNRIDKGKNFPVFLQFAANLPITAVGFAGCGGVPKCTVKGPCGGCFSLLADSMRSSGAGR